MSVLGEINYELEPEKPSLFLAKPNRTIISKMNEVYGLNLNLKLGGIHELTFNIPYEIDLGHKLVRNNNVDRIREKYLVKVVLGSSVEWYEISTIKEEATDSSDVKIVTAMYLPYELRGKLHRIYNTEKSGPKNLTSVATDALDGTLWTVGYVDASFDIVYRSFSINSQTGLDFLFQIADTFKAIIVWDSVNRRVNFYKQENVGINRGLIVSYYKYLKTLNKTITSDELVTRLKVYGKDDLSIYRLNPTGTDYLEDFSFFLFPFQRDASKNVIQSSDYMSDGLCNAILDYQNKVEEKKGIFTDLVAQKEVQIGLKSNAETGLFDIDLDLAVTKDNVDVQKSNVTYNSVKFTHSINTTTKNISLKANTKHAVMIYVSNSTGLTIKYEGITKDITSSQWVVIGKESVSSSTKNVSVSVTGTANAVDIQIISARITDNEFIGAAYEGMKIKSGGEANSKLTTTDKETTWKLVKIGDKVYIENIKQGGYQFNGINSDFAGNVTSVDIAKNEITIDAIYAIGEYINGYLITTANNDGIIISRYVVEYQQARYDQKKSDITSIDVNISVIDTQIKTLRNELSLEINFTSDQIKERNLFIIEREWIDQNYVYDTDLYEDAKKKFNLIKTPQTVIEIDVVNFLSVIEAQSDWDKLVLGDTITIRYEKFNVDVKAKIIEISFDYESGAIKLVIANVKEIESDEDKLIKMLYKSNSTSTTVDMNKYKWSETVKTVGDIGAILGSTWDAAKRTIVAGVNETVTIDGRGITITDGSDPLRFLRATHGVFGITNDGGNTYKQAITADGIIAERLYGQIIMGNNLIIGDQDGIFKLMGNKGIIYDRTGIEVMKLGLYNTDSITGAESFGLMLVNPTTKVIIDKDSGFKIQRLQGASTWNDVAWLDLQGKLNLKDIIASGTIEATTLSATTQLLVGNINVNDLIANGLQQNATWIKVGMIEAGSITADRIKVGELVVGTNVTMGANATISWGKVTSAPNFALSSDLASYVTNTALTTKLGQDYIITGKVYANQITAGTLNGFTITGTTITGASIYSGASYDGVTIENHVLYNNDSSPSLGPYKRGLYFDMQLGIIKNYDSGTQTPGYIGFGLTDFLMYGPMRFAGSVDFSGATVSGLNLTAKFG